MARVLRASLLALLGACEQQGALLPSGMPGAPCDCTPENPDSCKVSYQRAQLCPDLSPVQFCSRFVNSGYSTDVLRRSLALVTFSPGARQTAEQWDNAVRTYVSAGLVKPTQAREGDAWTNQYASSGASASSSSSSSPSAQENK